MGVLFGPETWRNFRAAPPPPETIKRGGHKMAPEYKSAKEILEAYDRKAPDVRLPDYKKTEELLAEMRRNLA